MEYVTGIYALNLNCELDTLGDWHFSAIDWNNIPLRDSRTSIYGDLRIAKTKLPTGTAVYAADHIRASVDLIEQGYYSSAQGMRDSFICNEKYTPIIFDLVCRLRGCENWKRVDEFMGREYLCDWLEYRKWRESGAEAS